MQGILFDMDGVIYNAHDPIPGAVDALAWVRARRIQHLFVTNTTSRDREILVGKLAGFGIPAVEADILTPCEVAANWLREQRAGKTALFLRAAARPAFDGLDCLPENAETGADYVVIGDLGSAWDFQTLNRAFRLLHSNPAAVLIALGMTRYWKSPDGISLDVAPFVAALEHATARKALVFGKPAPAFFEGAAASLGLPPSELLMVGDDIDADVGGAQRAGLAGALVRTGKFRPGDLEGTVRPDAVLDSVANLPEWWVRAQAQ